MECMWDNIGGGCGGGYVGVLVLYTDPSPLLLVIVSSGTGVSSVSGISVSVSNRGSSIASSVWVATISTVDVLSRGHGNDGSDEKDCELKTNSKPSSLLDCP